MFSGKKCFLGVILILFCMIQSASIACASEIVLEADGQLADLSITDGNMYRLREKISEAKNGNDITIAYIGGSITEGYQMEEDSCYAKRSFDFFMDRYGNGDNVHYLNAGLSGTSSALGNARYEKDVLCGNPDIVFIEFAVNDVDGEEYRESFESLVRTALDQENAPAVVLIFNRWKSGFTCQEVMKPIGEIYELPMISVADAITRLMDVDGLEWEEYSNDEVHPNEEGHAFIADLIAKLLVRAEDSEDESYELPKKTKKKAVLAHSSLKTPFVEDENIIVTDPGPFYVSEEDFKGFEAAWVCDFSHEGWVTMEIEAEAKTFTVILEIDNSESMGYLNVYVDGEYVTEISANQSTGWGQPEAFTVFRQKSKKKVLISLEPMRSDAESTQNLVVYGFAAN